MVPPVRVFLSLAVAIGIASGCTGSHQSSANTKTIKVFAPLSGNQAARGEVVVRMATLINQLLAQAPAAVPRIVLDLHDSNLAPERLAQAVAGLDSRTPVIVGGCAEAQAIFDGFVDPPFTVVMFCDALTTRGAIESADTRQRFFWIGPTLMNIYRAAEAYSVAAANVGIGSASVVYSPSDFADEAHLLAVLADVQSRGGNVHPVAIQVSDSLKIEDYSAQINALPSVIEPPGSISPLGQPVGLASSQHGLLWMLLPWLSSVEWLRQGQLQLAPSYWGQLLAKTYLSVENLTQDGPRDAYPVLFDNVNSLELSGTFNGAAKTQLQTDTTQQFGSGPLSMLSRLVADSLLSVALTVAAKPSSDADSLRSKWLEVIGAQPAASATLVSYANYLQGLELAAQGHPVDYDGVYSSMNSFDAAGQLQGVVAPTIDVLATSETGVGSLLDDFIFIFSDPLVGNPVQLATGVAKGCITFERPPGTVAWDSSGGSANLYDYRIGSGVTTQSNLLPGTVGLVAHFSQSLQMTSINWIHGRYTNYPAMHVTERISWWKDTMPAGFNPDSPPVPPDGEVVLPSHPIGQWDTLDWSFVPKEMKTLSIIADYDRGTPFRALFDDLEFFATPTSLDGFCQTAK